MYSEFFGQLLQGYIHVWVGKWEKECYLGNGIVRESDSWWQIDDCRSEMFHVLEESGEK